MFLVWVRFGAAKSIILKRRALFYTPSTPARSYFRWIADAAEPMSFIIHRFEIVGGMIFERVAWLYRRFRRGSVLPLASAAGIVLSAVLCAAYALYPSWGTDHNRDGLSPGEWYESRQPVYAEYVPDHHECDRHYRPYVTIREEAEELVRRREADARRFRLQYGPPVVKGPEGPPIRMEAKHWVLDSWYGDLGKEALDSATGWGAAALAYCSGRLDARRKSGFCRDIRVQYPVDGDLYYYGALEYCLGR